ncbi:hypothetical protein DPSP01_005292 [Paraphaeosphaeria sporulosa]
MLHREKLRTKTGCLTCRNRRKKCDEKTPACKRCLQSNRNCLWPTSEELLDRRFASHQRSRYALGLASEDQDILAKAFVGSSLVCRLSRPVVLGAISESLEGFLVRHFVQKYYRSLVLPNSHPRFANDWISEMQRLMRDWKSVRYSVLCNAASNVHLIESNGQMQELALTYYSQALRGLSDYLSRAELLANCNSILISMMLLCLHGCIGRGTYFDIPRHLTAATRVLSVRLSKQHRVITNPFDRFSLECVLYQIFLTSTGLWSDDEVNHRLDFHPDLDFWLRAERLLHQSNVFPDQSTSTNSPALGLPVRLLRLALTVKQMYQRAVSYDAATLNDIRSEMILWEDLVLRDQAPFPLSATSPQNSPYSNASHLYILVMSLLSNQLSLGSTADPPTVPLPADPESWQIQEATRILRVHADDPAWASSFIGTWPVYTLGFFLVRVEHVQLVRRDLRRRWEVTGFNQVARFCNDVERTWGERGMLGKDGLGRVGMCWRGTYYKAGGKGRGEGAGPR